MDRKKLGIYIHIPFCIKKCLYCDFLSDKACAEDKEKYIEALLNEIRFIASSDAHFAKRYEVASVFFGGGTPSTLSNEQIDRILGEVRNRFDIDEDAEITIECNPGTATKEKIEGWVRTGINRLSIGLQSASDEELKLLGRIHDFKQFEDTYKWARECGINNINIDIMSAIPGQTLESYGETLAKVVAFAPEHISSYSLIVEEETPFYEIYGEDKEAAGVGEYSKWPDLPDEDIEREMYYMTERVLNEAGYHRYEISNYSLPDRECRHNSSYWTGVEYLGLGLGASGYLNGIRYTNTSDWNVYINACNNMNCAQNEAYYPGAGDYQSYFEEEYIEEPKPIEENLSPRDFGQIILDEKYHEAVQLLSANESMEEFMFLGLRMMRGVSGEAFKERFHIDIEDVYGKVIEKLISEGMIERDGDRIFLTKTGIDVSNRVLANFLL